MTLAFVIIVLNLVLTGVIFFLLKREARRRRILQAFIAGTIRSVSDYISKTDLVDIKEIPKRPTSLPIPYEYLLDSVKCEFEKDFWMKPFNNWIRDDRNLFTEDRYANDGFTMMYYDLHDKELEDRSISSSSKSNP